MAPRKPTPTPPAEPPAAGTPTPPAADTAKPVFDWGTLAPSVAMPNKPVAIAIKVDVLASVPEPIRQRIEASLTINTERVNAKANSTAKRARVDYHWDLQPVADDKMGAAFVKLATKYAKYRPADKDVPHAGPTSPKGQITVRAGTPGHYRKDSAGGFVQCAADAEGAFFGVRYSARPFEQRQDAKALPGTS